MKRQQKPQGITPRDEAFVESVPDNSSAALRKELIDHGLAVPGDEETQPCPKCDKLMIVVETGITMLGNCIMHQRRWWCGCGHNEAAESLREQPMEPTWRDRWQAANEGS